MRARLRLAAAILAAVALTAAAATLVAQEAAPVAGPDSGVPLAPVELDGRVLFRVRGVTAYPAETRAAALAERIRQVARDPKVQVADLRLVDAEDRCEIRAGNLAIVSVFDADARVEGIARRELALVYLPILRAAIADYRDARGSHRLLVAAGQAAVASAILLAFLFLVVRLFRRLDGFVANRFRRRIEALQARSFEIVRVERVQALIRATAHSLRVLLILVAVYLHLEYTLALFPWTRFVSVRLTSWILGPLQTMWSGFVADIPDLMFLAVLAVVVRYALRVLRLFFDGIRRGSIRFASFEAEWAEPTYKIARAAVVAFALVVAYPYVPGSGSEAFKGVSIFLGVVFSLGSSSVMSNMVAGFAMTYRRAFRVGDRIRVGDVVGDVSAVRLQVTHLRTPKNEEVVIPNSTLLNTEVTNYTTLARDKGLILHTTVGIGYEVPWRQVEAMLRMAAERTEGLEKEPAPFVLQRSLGDFAVNYELNVYCRNPSAMNSLYSALHQSIQDVFNEYGVQIMTPAYESDTPEPKVVPKERWYDAPARGPEPGAD